MMQHLRFWALLLLLGSSITLATSYRVELLPASYLEYQISDGRGIITGRAPIESFTLQFDDTGGGDVVLEVILDPARFDSGSFLRDTNARRTVFDTDLYPLISFSGTDVEVATANLPPGATREAQVTGTLEMHGVTHEVTVPVTVARSADGDVFTATGSFSVLLSDYDMKRPSFLWIRVDDEVAISFVITGRLEP